MTDTPSDDPSLDRITQILRMLRTMCAPISRQKIGLDFADVRSGIKDAGEGYFGEGEASGPGRATVAAERALAEVKQHIRDRRTSDGRDP